MKLFLKLTLLIGTLIVFLGIILPMLFSAAHTELVILGVVLMVALIPFTYFVGRWIIISTLKNAISVGGKNVLSEIKSLHSQLKKLKQENK